MKSRKNLINLCIYAVFQLSFLIGIAQTSEIEPELKKFPEIISIQKIENHHFFGEAYEIIIDQYLDHKNPSAGKFNQRVILSHFNKYSPVVFVTEGYDANYAILNSYINELSPIVEGNQIIVEHRYFGKSMPSVINWDYLTIENSCSDLHRIQRIFQRLYDKKNKWIATGISKGGQLTMAYRAFFPNDVDVWIPYVAPLNYSVEDKRPSRFIIKTVGTETCRNAIQNFQKDVLMNREKILPLLDSLIAAKKYTFNISTEKVFDYCVLEYPFAFWQWGENCNSIPTDTNSARSLFNYLISISNPEYFSNEGIEPYRSFFVQAAKEFGYYGYELGELQPYLKINDTKNYINQIFLPKNLSCTFDKKTSVFINKSIQKDGNHMIFIYGEYDPWTSASIKLKSSSDAVKIVKPKGSHKTRITNLSYGLQGEIYKLLETWLEED